MGYMVKSLASLPLNDNIDLYVYTINGNFVGGDYELAQRNFEHLAQQLADNAAVVKGFDEFFSDQVCRKYLGKDQGKLWSYLPAFLITDAHPKQIDDDTLRLLAPLSFVQKQFSSFEDFLNELVQFSRGNNPKFLERFETEESWVDQTLEVVDLKPNFFGVGVNINAFIDRVRGRPTALSPE